MKKNTEREMETGHSQKTLLIKFLHNLLLFILFWLGIGLEHFQRSSTRFLNEMHSIPKIYDGSSYYNQY